ncbi:hypothetical protein PMAYCL1PPCAC_33235, partial [Pristionchus mayeri]
PGQTVPECRESARVCFEYSEAAFSYRRLSQPIYRRTQPPPESASADSDTEILPDAAKVAVEDGFFAGKLVCVNSWMHNTPDKRAMRGTAKTRLTNGDVYPQEVKQDEDNLSSDKLRKGFTPGPCPYEHESMNGHFDREDAHYRAAQLYMQVVQRKGEVNMITAKKPKDYVTQLPAASPMKAKDRVMWYQGLAKGKGYVALMQKPPTFKKKEHMFDYFYDFRITPTRAIWNLKLAAHIAASHSKKNKTFNGEIFTVEYAHAISRNIRQIFYKLFDMEDLDECDETNEKWWYFTRLSKTAFDEGVIDRQEYINELCNIFTDIFLRRTTGQEDTEYQLHLWMQYFHYFVPSATQNLVLARRIAVMMCQKLSLMKEEFEEEEADLLDDIREGRFGKNEGRDSERAELRQQQSASSSDSTMETDPPPPPPPKEPIISVKAEASKTAINVKMEEAGTSKSGERSTGADKPAEEVMGKRIKEEPLDEDEPVKAPGKTEVKKEEKDGEAKKETKIVYDPEHPDKFTFDVMFACEHLRQNINSLVTLLFSCIGEQPGAMVYNKYFVDLDRQPYMLTQLGGSPLDYLPCPLLDLPFDVGNEAAHDNILDLMEMHEHDIILRSEQVQNRWVPTFHTQRQHARLIDGCLDVVGYLDAFDILNKDAVEKVFTRIFMRMKYSRYAQEVCARIRLCLTWAITVQRDGQWRGWLVARVLKMLLDRRPHKEPYGYFGGTHILLIIVDFINNDLPKKGSEHYYKEFKNFCALFFELTRAEVMSHESLYETYTCYMKTYCRRNDLDPNDPIMNAYPPINDDGESKDGRRKEGDTSVGSEDFSRLDESIGSKMEVDDDDSIVEVKPEVEDAEKKKSPQENMVNVLQVDQKEKRMVSFITLPDEHSDGYGLLDEDIAPLEQLVIQLPISEDRRLMNTRTQMLYGNTLTRSNYIAAAKRCAAEYIKIIRRKMYYKWNNKNGEVRFARKSNSVQINELLQKLRQHTLFDRQQINNWVSDGFVNTLKYFTDGDSLQLPTFEALDLVCSLHEQTNNMHGFFKFLDVLVPYLPLIERVIRSLSSVIMPGLLLSQYTYVICSYLVKHFHYFVHYEKAKQVVNMLYRVMEKSLKADEFPRNGFGRTAAACIFHLREQLIRSEVVHSEEMLGGTKEFEHIFDQGDDASRGNINYNKMFMMDQLHMNKIVTLRIYEYHDFKKRLPSFNNPVSRYSFVVNAFVAASKLERDFDKLSELATFCSHWTAHYPEMANDWMGAIRALCTAKNSHMSFGFHHLLEQIDVSDCKVHYSLSTFAVLLASKYCYSIPKIISEIINSTFSSVIKKESAKSARGSSAYKDKTDYESEPNVCIALLYLAQMACGSDDPFILSEHYRGRAPVKKLLECGSADLNILSMVHWCELDRVMFPMIANIGIMNDTLQMRVSSLKDHDLKLEEVEGPELPKREYRREFLPLIVRQALISICEQDWVKDRMFKIAEVDDMAAFNQDRLKQNCLGMQLLRLGTRRRCEREILAQLSVCNGNSKKALIDKLFSVLNIWNFRATLYDLRLMIKERSPESSNKHTQQGAIAAEALMVEIAKCCRELFVQAYKSNKIIMKKDERFSFASLNNYLLIPTLINMCPTPYNMPSSFSASFKSKFLTEVCNMLDVGAEPNTERLKMSAWLINDRAFLNTIMACMKGSHEDRAAKDAFMNSLLKQIQDLSKIKENHLYHYKTAHGEERKGIFLRIQLVGYIFDEVCRMTNNTYEGWALIFFQLMLHGVVTPFRNIRMYNIVFDMLSNIIMWSLTDKQGSSPVDKDKQGPSVVQPLVEDGKNNPEVKYRFPNYMGIVKKLRKELHDTKTMMETKNLHAFLPLPKNIQQMLAFEPFGTQPSNSQRNIRLSQQANIGLRRGRPCLQVKKNADRIRITAFEMLQGYNPDHTNRRFPLMSFYMGTTLNMSMVHPYRVIQRMMGHTHTLKGCVTNPLQLEHVDKEGRMGDEGRDVFLDPVAMENVGEPPWIAKRKERQRLEAEKMKQDEERRKKREEERKARGLAPDDDSWDEERTVSMGQTVNEKDKQGEREQSVATPAALAGPEVMLKPPMSNDTKKEVKEEEVVVLNDSPLKGMVMPGATSTPMKETELSRVISQPIQQTALTAHLPPGALAAMGAQAVPPQAPPAPIKAARRRSTAKDGAEKKERKRPTKRNAPGLPPLQTSVNPPLMATPPKPGMLMNPGMIGQPNMGMNPAYQQSSMHHTGIMGAPDWSTQSQQQMQSDFGPPQSQTTSGPATTLSQLMGHHQPGQPQPQQQPTHLQQTLQQQQMAATAGTTSQQHPSMMQQQPGMSQQQQQQMMM